MPVSCVVKGCTKRFEKDSGVSWYRFPANEDKRRLWICALRRPDWIPSPHHSRICGRHFLSGKPSDDPKDPDFIPTRHMMGSVKDAALEKEWSLRVQRIDKHRRDREREWSLRTQRKEKYKRDHEGTMNGPEILPKSQTSAAEKSEGAHSLTLQDTEGSITFEAIYAATTSSSSQSSPSGQHSPGKYGELLAVIEELGKDIRPTYAGSRNAAERLKKGIMHARALVRECLIETERCARN